MASRRDRHYEEDDRSDRRSTTRREAERRTIRDEAPREPKKSKGPSNLNSFFIKGEGIHREVLQKEICKFLGPEATSKPGVYNDVDGYVIKAVRTFTPQMLDDLQELSSDYVSERKEKEKEGGRGLRDFVYEHSETSRSSASGRRTGQDVDMGDIEDEEEVYYRSHPPRVGRDIRDLRDVRDPRDIRDPRENRDTRDSRGYGTRGPADPRDPRDLQYPSANPYTTGPSSTPASAYVSGYPAAAPGVGYPQSNYPLDNATHHQGSPYTTSAYPPVTRPEGNYVYGGSEYPTASDPYTSRQAPTYAVPAGRDPGRIDYRDTRDFSQGNRIESREPQRQRAEPRYAPLSPPGGGDVAMGGIDDDRYYQPGPTSQSARGPYAPSSRPTTSPYDLGPADLREPYRPPPSREERRPRR